MGVSEVWDLLKPYLVDSRIPFIQFVTDFIKKYGRKPCIAVDAFQWLFECGFITRSSDNNIVMQSKSRFEIKKCVLNWLSRMKEFMSLDIDFILVFDGPMKPVIKDHQRKKKTDGIIHDSRSYSMDVDDHLRNHMLGYGCESNRIDDPIRIVIEICDVLHVSYIFGCGEGEAECARLQYEGYVDYVLSNDSDTLIFGSSKVLKNYSKYPQDLPSSSSHVTKNQSKYNFVTVVDLEDISKKNPVINQKSLILFCILLGADYNAGIKNLGYQRAARISQWCNPNFSENFWNLFATGVTFDKDKELDYQIFQRELFKYCRNNCKKMFGQNIKTIIYGNSFTEWPHAFVILKYFHPIVMPEIKKEVFTNKYNNTTGNFHPCKNLPSKLLSIGIDDALSNFSRWYHNFIHTCALIKTIAHGHDEIFCNFKITDEKTETLINGNFKLSMYKIRYNTFLDDVTEPQDLSPSKIHMQKKTRSPSRKQIDKSEFTHYNWIPEHIIHSDHPLLTDYHRRKSVELKTPIRKRPIVKSSYSQKNNLNKFLSEHTSPVRNLAELLKKSALLPEDDHTILCSQKNSIVIQTDNDDDDDDSLIVLGEFPSPQKRHKSSKNENILGNISTNTLKSNTHVLIHSSDELSYVDLSMEDSASLRNEISSQKIFASQQEQICIIDIN